jgi:hypothetical protein
MLCFALSPCGNSCGRNATGHADVVVPIRQAQYNVSSQTMLGGWVPLRPRDQWHFSRSYCRKATARSRACRQVRQVQRNAVMYIMAHSDAIFQVFHSKPEKSIKKKTKTKEFNFFLQCTDRHFKECTNNNDYSAQNLFQTNHFFCYYGYLLTGYTHTRSNEYHAFHLLTKPDHSQ